MSQSTTDTVTGDTPGPDQDRLEFSSLPPVYILASHLSGKDQTFAEDVLSDGGAPLTYDIKEANLILGNISTCRRAKLELQWKGVHSIEVDEETLSESEASTQTRKRRKVRSSEQGNRSSSLAEDDTPESQTLSQLSLSQVSTADVSGQPSSQPRPGEVCLLSTTFKGRVVVAKLAWLHQSLRAKQCLPLGPFVLYQAKIEAKTQAKADTQAPVGAFAQTSHSAARRETTSSPARRPIPTPSIIERAKKDETPTKKSFRRKDRIKEAAQKDVV